MKTIVRDIFNLVLNILLYSLVLQNNLLILFGYKWQFESVLFINLIFNYRFFFFYKNSIIHKL